MSSILIIDDESAIQNVLEDILRDEGYQVYVASDGIEGLKLLQRHPIDIVFLDVWLPGKGGIDVLMEIKSTRPEVEVIIISGHATVETAVKAIKLGAYDYLEKPLDLGRVVTLARHSIQLELLKRENATLRKNQFLEDEMIGNTEKMQKIREIIAQSAPSDSRVMILGENGTGKELVARMIHSKSNRSSRSFVEVNCAAIPENLIESELFGHEKGAFTNAVARRRGKFELADGGTLFLDEVADMTLEAQAKMLRTIQEMTFERVGGEEQLHVDVRIISATNKNIIREIEGGNFREDLYFRLNVIPLSVPSLRERQDDLPILIDYFHKKMRSGNDVPKLRFTDEAMRLLMEYSWPGNIRELKNFIERVTILVDEAEVTEETARFYLGEARSKPSKASLYQEYEGMKLSEAKNLFEKRMVERCLEENRFNIAKTAQAMGVYPSNLHGKIKKYRIEIKK
ncbi:two component, sigma54 specific, transcriptional regulator, Fis family [Olavius algarvensis spirochete endosymbiont]|uniref:sigma-54-dependent transcriptional regulator n=1 Tax=Olavius algarvensis spirochete endosymbiont TaxID=260710 RepID=UPI000F1C4660|nr:sigma-54 dependent transcriptional regulator [Olavius algarvensis spirochete endosymbiont]VDB00059.1 two component, sigma54 specific, transcriptional regulator, Fis family [Olavius algarvensis spirochete endosymbiont]